MLIRSRARYRIDVLGQIGEGNYLISIDKHSYRHSTTVQDLFSTVFENVQEQ